MEGSVGGCSAARWIGWTGAASGVPSIVGTGPIGVAAAVDVPWQTPTPVGIPKTGFPTEQMAHTAVANIVAQVRGQTPDAEKAFGDIPAVCVMDAGNNGVIILADKMLPPRKHGILIPGPQAHLMKLGFEKYFLWKMQHGQVRLP